MPLSMTAEQPRLLVVAALVWLDPGRLLFQRRRLGASHGAGMLEFPGGKVERGEAPRAALARELVEEWGPGAAVLRVGPIAEVLHHRYAAPGPEVVLLLYHVQASALVAHGPWQGLLTPEEGVTLYESALEDLSAPAFLAADRALIARLVRRELACPWAPGPS